MGVTGGWMMEVGGGRTIPDDAETGLRFLLVHTWFLTCLCKPPMRAKVLLHSGQSRAGPAFEVGGTLPSVVEVGAE